MFEFTTENRHVILSFLKNTDEACVWAGDSGVFSSSESALSFTGSEPIPPALWVRTDLVRVVKDPLCRGFTTTHNALTPVMASGLAGRPIAAMGGAAGAPKPLTPNPAFTMDFAKFADVDIATIKSADSCWKASVAGGGHDYLAVAPGAVTRVVGSSGQAVWCGELSGAGVSGRAAAFAASASLVRFARETAGVLGVSDEPTDESGGRCLSVSGKGWTLTQRESMRSAARFLRFVETHSDMQADHSGESDNFGFVVSAALARKSKTALGITDKVPVGFSSGGDVFISGKTDVFSVADTGRSASEAHVVSGSAWRVAGEVFSMMSKHLGDPYVELLQGGKVFRFTLGESGAVFFMGSTTSREQVPAQADLGGEWVSLSTKRRAMLKALFKGEHDVLVRNDSLEVVKGNRIEWTNAPETRGQEPLAVVQSPEPLFRCDKYQVSGPGDVRALRGASLVGMELSEAGGSTGTRLALSDKLERTVIEGTEANVRSFRYAAAAVPSGPRAVSTLLGARVEVGFRGHGNPLDGLSAVVATDSYRLHSGVLDVSLKGPSFTVPGCLLPLLSTQEGWLLETDGHTISVVFPRADARVLVETPESRGERQYPSNVVALLSFPHMKRRAFSVTMTSQQWLDAKANAGDFIAIHANGAAWDAHGAAEPRVFFTPGHAFEQDGDSGGQWWLGLNTAYVDRMLTPILSGEPQLVAFYTQVALVDAGRLMGAVMSMRFDGVELVARGESASTVGPWGPVERGTGDDIFRVAALAS